MQAVVFYEWNCAAYRFVHLFLPYALFCPTRVSVIVLDVVLDSALGGNTTLFNFGCSMLLAIQTKCPLPLRAWIDASLRYRSMLTFSVLSSVSHPVLYLMVDPF